MKRITIGMLVLFTFFAPYLVLANEPIIYPIKNQTPEQQEKDEFECYKWAKTESGFDPMNQQITATPASEPQQKGRPVLRSAARAGAIGAVTGSIVGDTSDAKKGAAVGAAAGGMSAAFQKRDANQQQAEATQSQVMQTEESLNTYYRAFAACMGGRGYNVQ